VEVAGKALHGPEAARSLAMCGWPWRGLIGKTQLSGAGGVRLVTCWRHRLDATNRLWSGTFDRHVPAVALDVIGELWDGVVR